jgi:DNA topoisomerase-3
VYKENYEQKGGRKKLDIRAENVQNEQNRVGEKNPVTMKLVVTEKPSVARSIAAVIGAEENKDGYMEGNGYLVSWCVGHLVELAQPESYGEKWKKWTYESLPIKPEKWRYEVKADTKAQYDVLFQLMHREDVSAVICATDAGREGELIFRLVYEMAGCDKPVRRLWISSMEESAIREGFENLQPGSDYDNLYHSALCRQEADWLVGINGTRLFTVLYGGKVLKVGRVQTPTLAMLVDRETKIMNFQKEKYYMAHILMDGTDAATGRIDDKNKAEEIAGACQNGQALVTSVIKEEKSVMPPKLYDLTTLQRDANRLFGFTAKQTLEYTQSLYEKKLATYPRTDSQFLSDDMGQTARNVIEAVFTSLMFEESMIFNPNIKRVLDSRKVTDHHAIIPTMEIAKADLASLPETERKILSLIANRLLCATGEKHLYETVRAEFSCGGHTFSASGKSVTHNGWKAFDDVFKRTFKTVGNKEDENGEKKLPELSEGQTFDGVQTKITEHFTNPPKRFTEDLLLAAMERAGTEDMGDEVERKGLGTPATRADIIEKLVRDGFVKREQTERSSVCGFIPTEDGMKLITVLPDVVKSPKLTADWENALMMVAKGELPMEDFMADIENMVSELIHTYHEVSDEQKKMFAQEQETLGTCPNCGGQVAKGKFGAYCKNKCGMNVSRIMGAPLSDEQVKDMLAGKKVLLKGLRSKADKPYDAYIIPIGTEEYRYTKDGEEKSGVQFQFKMEFPQKKSSGKKK